MTIQSFTAEGLFEWIVNQESFLLLDVRNEEEFGRFKVEGPHPIEMVNVPYMEFIEHEEESVAKVPKGKNLKIVCAREGSSKYVGEILINHGFEDVAHMLVGIKAWGNLLAPICIASNSGYELYQFRRPGKASCSYGLLFDKEMMLFDPAKNIEAYKKFARDKNCVITKTFETHRQADYISGSMALKEDIDAEIIAPTEDFSVATFDFTPAGDNLVYGFSNGGPEIKSIHTPGHTPGSTSYLIDDKFIISGDTIFIRSIGRPDLGGMAEEWSSMLFKTMTEKIIPLNESILVLPGHYMDWKEANKDLIFTESMGKIKEINSNIYGMENENEFYQFIKSNIRPQPEEYATIREINAGLKQVDEEKADIMDLGKNECAASMHQSA
ncbi:MAG: MBL fold metallo-hydrolase [Deltaproteobacteria bacterium]|nr:MBL fold metallo-hydrolase [Deltaproteobacteria bacterium]